MEGVFEYSNIGHITIEGASQITNTKKGKTFSLLSFWRAKNELIQQFNISYIISLACVSSETHNLQRFFRLRGWGGVLPYIGYIHRYVLRQRVCFFSRFGLR